MAETPSDDLFDHIQALVIDDDRDMLALIASVLHSVGIDRVRAISNPKIALRQIEDHTHTYDLVICDWSMPDMTGLDILKSVRKHAPRIAFVMLTANVMSDAVREARDLGVDAYVAKPFTTIDLQAKVRTVLAKRAAKTPPKKK